MQKANTVPAGRADILETDGAGWVGLQLIMDMNADRVVATAGQEGCCDDAGDQGSHFVLAHLANQDVVDRNVLADIPLNGSRHAIGDYPSILE